MKQPRRNGVYWIEDDTFPSPWESQAKRMQILAGLDVPVRTALI